MAYDNVRLVIFDCDGVLIDSELIACGAEANALTEIGFAITRDQVVDRFAGVPSDAMYATIEAEMGRKLPPDFEARVKETVLQKYRTDLQSIDGVGDVLAGLPVAKCVASSSNPAKLALGLIETGLFEALYPNIFSTALVPRGKPHPDIFEYAAKAMGANPSECLVVEDSIAGITAAKVAGMRSIGFVGGSHVKSGHDDRLVGAGAEAVIKDIRKLLEMNL